MEEIRTAMAEQTANASARHVNVVAGEDKLHEELQFLRNQLSEVLAATMDSHDEGLSLVYEMI